jgi:trigger factor
MEVVKKEIDKLNAEITIKIQEADYKDKVDTALRNYRKKANLPGFRKGMVPMGMVKNMVGTNLLVEEVNKVLSDTLYKFISDSKLDVLGNPLPKKEDAAAIDWDKQKEFSFTYEIGISPEVKIDITDKDKFEKLVIKADEKMIANQISEIAKRYGKMVEADKSEDEDMLFGKWEELEGKTVKEGGITNETVLNIRTVNDKKNQKKFIGKVAGDIVTVKPQEIADAQYVAAWLGIDQEYISDQTSEFQYTISKINRMEEAELNQEFFDKIYGKDTVKTKAEMEEKLRAEMTKSFEQNAEQLFEREVQDHLIKKAKLELPDEFMKKWLMNANEKPITKEQIESEYEQYALGLKWQLIENKLIKDNKIEVTKEEVVAHTKGLIAQQLSGMGGNMMEDAEMDETANRVLENQEEAKRLYEQLYAAKLREFYNATAKIKQKEISYDDFVKLAEKKRTK